MTGQPRGGADLPRGAQERKTALDEIRRGTRGFDRGSLTTMPLEDIVVGKDLFLAPFDVGHLPFMLRGLAVQASDSALGTLSVGLYRVDGNDVFPTRWSARLAGSVSIAVAADDNEFCGVLAQDKELDRVSAAWLVAVLGSTSTMVVRGTKKYTPPSFAGWQLGAPGALPSDIDSRSLTWTLAVPSVALLSQAGVRLRGTGTIPT